MDNFEMEALASMELAFRKEREREERIEVRQAVYREIVRALSRLDEAGTLSMEGLTTLEEARKRTGWQDY